MDASTGNHFITGPERRETRGMFLLLTALGADQHEIKHHDQQHRHEQAQRGLAGGSGGSRLGKEGQGVEVHGSERAGVRALYLDKKAARYAAKVPASSATRAPRTRDW